MLFVCVCETQMVQRLDQSFLCKYRFKLDPGSNRNRINSHCLSINREFPRQHLPQNLGSILRVVQSIFARQPQLITVPLAQALLQTMQSTMLKVIGHIATTISLCILAPSAAATDDMTSRWPETVVKIEELQPLTPFQLKVPGLVSKGRVTGPSILKAHITEDGTVAKVELLDSCGNPDLDESAIHALRAMRFKPITFGGAPTEATLALPVHVPVRFGRSR